MSFHIRWATAADAPAAYRLIAELAEYEKAPQEVTVSCEQFVEDGFGAQPRYRLLVAEHLPDTSPRVPKIVGIALFYDAYSTWKGKTIYLDDLVVTEAYRRYGIGKQLIDEVLRVARAENANQVRWHVLNWNEPAIRFYQKMGLKMEANWITCKYEKNLLYAQL
ncbi:MAG: GNAT family N-acetyltransferase [Chitinophagales bacterium]|nr:GNAT family N-acetyltransferase [Chitinophagales bacterium]